MPTISMENPEIPVQKSNGTRIIPFGVLLKLWASGQIDAFLLLLWDLQLVFIHFACYQSSVKTS